MSLDQIEMEDIRRIIGACGEDMRRLKGKTVLITGASGFLARYLVETWIELSSEGLDGARLLLASRRPSKLREIFAGRLEDPTVHLIDSSQEDWCSEDSSRCDFVVHCAAPSDPASYNKDPQATMVEIMEGTRQVINVAKSSNALKMLYMSSGAIYGVQPRALALVPESYTGGPSLESPTSCYAEAKRFCEIMVRSSGVPFTVARGFSFIGPHQDLRSSFAAADFIRQASENGIIKIKGDGRPVRSYCYEADSAIVMWKLLLCDLPHDVYNLGSDRHVTDIGGLARTVAKIFGDIPVIIEGKKQEGLAPRYVPDCGRQRKVHDPCVGIEDGITRSVSSMVSHGSIRRGPGI